jgi:hypothetical protein
MPCSWPGSRSDPIGTAVLVGGLAVFAYQWHPGFRSIAGITPLPTTDIDMALANPLADKPEGHLAMQLTTAGFTRRDVTRQETS